MSPDKKFLLIRSLETGLWFNLALESYLLNTYAPAENLLYLWQNDRCIVIGRYQNPWAECRLEKLREDGVVLGRRPSGGGAVYQDLGNACFTFGGPKAAYDKGENFNIVLSALSSLGLDCSLSGRNDVLVSGKKVSGSAFQLSRDFCSHHATMLVSADLQKVGEYLTPSQVKLQAKGVKSVSSRVADLVDFQPSVTVEKFYSALMKAYSDRHGDSVAVREFSKKDLAMIPELAEAYGHFASEAWIYGKTPEFTHTVQGRIGMGCVEFCLDVQSGVIARVSVFSDTLECGVVEQLQQLLEGSPYEKAAIRGLQGEAQNGLVAEALGFLAGEI